MTDVFDNLNGSHLYSQVNMPFAFPYVVTSEDHPFSKALSRGLTRFVFMLFRERNIVLPYTFLISLHWLMHIFDRILSCTSLH